MTIDDLDPPTHPVSSPEDRDRLLAEALVHAELQEAQYRQPLTEAARTGQWKAPLAFVVLLLAAYIGVAPPGWVAGEPPLQVTPAALERGVVAALHLQAQQIEAFRVRNGRLPRTLEELPIRVPGVRFVRSNNRLYQLVAARPDGQALVYDSANPELAFEQIAAGWNPEPGSQ